MAMAGGSPSGSLKLFSLPPDLIKSETGVPVTPEGFAVSARIPANLGVKDGLRVGRAMKSLT